MFWRDRKDASFLHSLSPKSQVREMKRAAGLGNVEVMTTLLKEHLQAPADALADNTNIPSSNVIKLGKGQRWLINAVDEEEWSALHEACWRGNTRCLG